LYFGHRSALRPTQLASSGAVEFADVRPKLP
jgi:hypothetical protein